MPDKYSPEQQIVDVASEKDLLGRRLIQAKEVIREKNEIFGLLINCENPSNQQIQTNRVINGLGEKILKTSEICFERSSDQDMYITAGKVLIYLFESIDLIGSGSVRFRHLADKERLSGQKVSYFKSDPYFIDSKEMTMVIQIRPENDYIEAGGKKLLKSQARTNIIIKSAELPHGEAGVRVDPPDYRHGNNIIYDISVGRADQKHATIIDLLDLEQKAGHHFPSGIRIDDLQGVDVPDIHRTISARLEELVVRDQNLNL